MRRFTLAALLALALAAVPAGALAARNPSGKGLPSQNCEEVELTTGSEAPGKASGSIGSPFNEAGLNTPEGGIGGQHYNETSQYDVACFQVSQR
jgi:hypothetical protein